MPDRRGPLEILFYGCRKTAFIIEAETFVVRSPRLGISVRPTCQDPDWARGLCDALNRIYQNDDLPTLDAGSERGI